MSTETLTFKVEPSNPSVPLQLSVWLNDQCCMPATTITEPFDFSTAIADEEGKQYTLKILMSGKTDEHTKIDDQGNIIQDTVLNFSKFDLMGIGVDQIIYNTAIYRHNRNGHSDDVEEKFFSSMGCNGTVELNFTTPIYLWLLENM